MSQGPTNETAIIPAAREPAAIVTFTPEKVELLKRTICRGASDDELELFLHACKRTGLDPFMRQIYAVKRREWDPDTKQSTEKMVIQTGIDGYRLIADRTGRYMPGRKPTYEYDEDNQLVAATAYVKKLDQAGQWHEIEAEAQFDEYCARKKGGEPTAMWAGKPHIMLAKCAEALVLRKAFPAEMSGVYTKEEMEQADNETVVTPAPRGQAEQQRQRTTNGRQAVNPETGEVVDPGADDDDEMPDVGDRDTFYAEWHRTLRGRQWTDEEAKAVLDGILAHAKRTLDQVDVDGRRELIIKADEGRYDTYRDALRAKAKKQQQGGGEVAKPADAAKQEPADAGDGETPPPATDEEVASWDKFLAAAWAAAGSDVTRERFDDGIGKALGLSSKRGKGETTTKDWRRRHLDAIRAGAFEWSEGKINKVAEALA